MSGQISLFDGEHPLRIDKPIRLIELFAGIGAQAKALENLGVPFEHYRICEFDKYAVRSYNAVHGTEFGTSDISLIHPEDVCVCDTDRYTYIMTYSFPCTDLSSAGKQAGMSRDSGTRSGLLWQVERLLKEMDELPQILLMENVPEVVSDKNMKDFAEWIAFLDGLGYRSKYEILNSKNYGVPQNRERCFMVSWLGDYYYNFPEPFPLEIRLKDVLEPVVDEKYYLSDEQVAKLKLSSDFIERERETVCGYLMNRNEIGNPTEIASTLMARGWFCMVTRCRCIGTLTGGKWDKMNESCCRVYDPEYLSPTLTTHGGGNQDVKIIEPQLSLVGGIGDKKFGGTSWIQGDRVYDANGIAATITAQPCGSAGGQTALYAVEPVIGAIRGRNPDNPSDRKPGIPTQQRLEIGSDVSNTLTTVQKDNVVVERMPFRVRKLTPKECWRLMGFDDDSFERAEQVNSNSQLYKQAGNSIVVDVLMAIFKEMF